MTTQLYTQCRGCGEVFRLSVEALTCAYGRVRCSVCGTVFNALDTLTDQPADGDLPLHDGDNAPPLLQHPEDGELVIGSATDNHEPTSKQHSSVLPESGPGTPFEVENDKPPATEPTGSRYQPAPAFSLANPAAPRTDLPPTTETGAEDLFAHVDEDDVALLPEDELPAVLDEPASRPANISRAWGLGALALALLLLGQAAIGIKKGLLNVPDAPWARQLCQTLDCPGQPATPLVLERIASISSSIRPHPGREDALIVSTTFMNTADAPMPFPALQVTLSDLDGHTVARRRFLPDEYLPDTLRGGQMLPQTLIPVTLEILKPEGQANAFQIDFSQPGEANEQE